MCLSSWEFGSYQDHKARKPLVDMIDPRRRYRAQADELANHRHHRQPRGAGG
jgi:hypothetical protein